MVNGYSLFRDQDRFAWLSPSSWFCTGSKSGFCFFGCRLKLSQIKVWRKPAILKSRIKLTDTRETCKKTRETYKKTREKTFALWLDHIKKLLKLLNFIFGNN